MFSFAFDYANPRIIKRCDARREMPAGAVFHAYFDINLRTGCQYAMLDFLAIKSNAANQGVPLTEIAIIYANLTDDELRQLNLAGLLIKGLGDGKAIGRFASNNDVLFPERAESVLTLSA